MQIFKQSFRIMLNVEINRYNNFGSKEGLFFVYRHIKEGTLSVASLRRFIIHNPGHVDVDLNATILLFILLDILDYDIESDTIILKNKDISSFDCFVSFLEMKVIDFVLRENIINLETISYDAPKDRFYIYKKCIQIKFACFRNLLLTLNILENRTFNTYYISSNFVNFIQPYVKRKKIISQEELLDQLNRQMEQGEAGESFVLEYEKKRLQGHYNIEAIKQVSIIDVSAGYDIASFNDLDSKKLDRFIEVKTYSGKPNFHWSSNEMDIAKLKSKHYFIYLVSYEDIGKDGYEPLIIQDPISFFECHLEWQFSLDSVTVSKQ